MNETEKIEKKVNIELILTIMLSAIPIIDKIKDVVETRRLEKAEKEYSRRVGFRGKL